MITLARKGTKLVRVETILVRKITMLVRIEPKATATATATGMKFNTNYD